MIVQQVLYGRCKLKRRNKGPHYNGMEKDLLVINHNILYQ